MELLLFEPRLSSAAGHYNRYVRVFAGEAARRGARISVAASSQIVPRFKAMLEDMGVTVLPVFEPMTYRMARTPAERDAISRAAANTALACHRERPQAIPAWMSGTGALLGAACIFAGAVRRPFLFQMLDFADDWPAGQLTAPADLRAAVHHAVDCGMRIEAQSPLIARHLESELGTPVGVFPTILDLQPLKERPKRSRPLVGMTNMLRKSKNNGAALSALMAHGDRISLLLHTGEGTTREAVEQLKDFTDELGRHYGLRHQQVQIVAGVLPPQAYAEMWQSLDCVVIPYDRTRYLRQGSGMLFEALADAIIPIAPLGTSMAATMTELGMGITYDDDDRMGLHGAIATMLRDFDSLSDRLRGFAPVYREANAPARIMDAMLGAGGA